MAMMLELDEEHITTTTLNCDFRNHKRFTESQKNQKNDNKKWLVYALVLVSLIPEIMLVVLLLA